MEECVSPLFVCLYVDRMIGLLPVMGHYETIIQFWLIEVRNEETLIFHVLSDVKVQMVLTLRFYLVYV